jgi:hypothetical protein
MKDLEKSILTLIAWIGCFVLAIHAMNTDMTIGIILAFAGAFGFPMLLWGDEEQISEFFMGDSSADDDEKQATSASQTSDKLKRKDSYDQKMRLLMELMDDDEREAFKQTLKDQVINRYNHLADGLVDGELPFDAEEFDLYNRK